MGILLNACESSHETLLAFAAAYSCHATFTATTNAVGVRPPKANHKHRPGAWALLLFYLSCLDVSAVRTRL